MEVSLIQKWDKHLKELASVYPTRTDDKMPEHLFTAKELVLEDGTLKPTEVGSSSHPPTHLSHNNPAPGCA